MEHKEPASTGQRVGSIMFAGGLVGAFLAGQMVKNGSLAVGSFCLALVGLVIYLVSVVGRAVAADREMHPRPAPPIVQDYPEDQADDGTVLQGKGIAASGDQVTGPRRRGFLSGLGDGASLPHTSDR